MTKRTGTTGRGLRSDGARTREAILRTATSLATVRGLEGLSIGELAADVGMSKSGLYAHFSSKQDLQLATVAAAAEIFEEEVIGPAMTAGPGVARLVAVCEAFFEHLRRGTFPGGCFFSGAAVELGARDPGPVRAEVVAFQRGFSGLLRDLAETAVQRGELPDDEDPRQLAFELGGIILAANSEYVLDHDPVVLDLARAVVRRRLGVA